MADSGIADGVERRLDPRSVAADRIGTAVGGAVLALVGFVATVVVLFATPLGLASRLALLALWGGSVVALGLYALLWPAVRYRHTAYTVSEEGILIRRGVFWRTSISVPKSRVQHTDVSQGPVLRSFDLACLVIYTAGTHHASVSLGGLAHATAVRIRDHLVAGGRDDAV